MPQREWHSDVYGSHSGEVVATVAGHDVIDCRICGFKHVVPLPTAEQLQTFYEDEFYQSEKENYLSEADEDFAWKQVEMRLRFSVATKMMTSGGNSLLDIGSGPGDFMAVGQDLGWQCVGVEPSRVACDFAKDRGLKAINGFFDAELAGQLGSFDFIHLSEVLEHVPDPIELLATAEKLLKPGGVLGVSVPNDFNPLQAQVVKGGRAPWWVVPDHHLNYFDFDSLERLISSSGLDCKRRLTNFPMELFLLMGQDYTSDPSLGRQLHAWRKAMDIQLAQNEETQAMLYESLANAGFGRLAIVFASKPGR